MLKTHPTYIRVSLAISQGRLARCVSSVCPKTTSVYSAGTLCVCVQVDKYYSIETVCVCASERVVLV